MDKIDKNTADCLVQYLPLCDVVVLIRVSKHNYKTFRSTIRFKKLLNLRHMADNFEYSVIMNWDIFSWVIQILCPVSVAKYVFQNKAITDTDLEIILCSIKKLPDFLIKFTERKMLKYASPKIIQWYHSTYGFKFRIQFIRDLLYLYSREDLYDYYQVTGSTNPHIIKLRCCKLKDVSQITTFIKEKDLIVAKMSLIDDSIMHIFPFKEFVPSIYPHIAKHCTVEQYEYIDRKFHGLLSNVMELMALYAAFGRNCSLLKYLLPLVKKRNRKPHKPKVSRIFRWFITRQVYLIFKDHDMLPFIQSYLKEHNTKWWN